MKPAHIALAGVALLAGCELPPSHNDRVAALERDRRDYAQERARREHALEQAAREREHRWEALTAESEASVAAIKAKFAAMSGTRSVEVLTEPPGARIILDNDYVGDSPLSVEVTFEKVGMYGSEVYVLQAMPTREMVAAGTASGAVQNKRLHITDVQEIPARVFFDMLMRPVGTEVNVTIEGR